MCPIFLRSSQTSVYPIFSQSFDADFHSHISRGRILLKKKKKLVRYRPNSCHKVSAMLGLPALTFDAVALFILLLLDEEIPFFLLPFGGAFDFKIICA